MNFLMVAFYLFTHSPLFIIIFCFWVTPSGALGLLRVLNAGIASAGFIMETVRGFGLSCVQDKYPISSTLSLATHVLFPEECGPSRISRILSIFHVLTLYDAFFVVVVIMN